MAVTTDIATIRDIHPPNKQDVGKRLALWALANTYGKKDLVYSGPLYESMAVEGDKIRIKFKHTVPRAGGPRRQTPVVVLDRRRRQAVLPGVARRSTARRSS